ncbi:MAG: hypothetical protein ACRC9H_17710 [Aeromonas veronii]
MQTIIDNTQPGDEQTGDVPLSLAEYAEIHEEIETQPAWRAIADKEMDYADGNQLDTELLTRQKALGIPPAVEDLIGPALLSIQGYESSNRTDWRVSPNGDVGGQDVADALNYRLNTAERQSGADRACSDAFRPQIACGLGWVEVARESDPFKYPYRCKTIRRDEIHWDMRCGEDWEAARYLRRQRWLPASRIAMVFPEHAELIKAVGKHGATWWGAADLLTTEGGMSTGLQSAWDESRGWSVQEDRWYNPTNKDICLIELWYRRWVQVHVLKTPDGRVVEYDANNPAHVMALASGKIRPQVATVARVRRSYWIGPHCLHDGPSPYTHRHFPYVPFFGFREDQTGIPYGYVRGMKFPQDSLNSGISKLRWGMSVVRVERTKGAVAMTDAQFRRQIARPDADIVLDDQHMAKQGARFEVHRDYQLTDQHFQMLNDNRAAIQRVSAVTSALMGKDGTATSGLQEQTQVEQANQSLGKMMDNFRAGRALIGELLLAMIIEDIGTQRMEVVIEGDAVTADRTVVLNEPQRDPVTGMTYLSNDLLRTRLMVALEDVPSTTSYRGQQLNAMSEAVKAMPPQYQAAVLPFLVSLMDVPFKRDVVEAIRGVDQPQTPEQQAAVDKAVQDALAKAQHDLKQRDLDLKERKLNSEIKGMDADTVLTLIQAMYSSMQGGAQVAQMPMIAPIADEMMKGAGYVRPPQGQDPNFPAPADPAAMNIAHPYIQGQGPQVVEQNTSPAFPPQPDTAPTGQQGIETGRVTDNLPMEPGYE